MSKILPQIVPMVELCHGRVYEAELGWAKTIKYEGLLYPVSAQPKCCGPIHTNDKVSFNFTAGNKAYIHHVLMQPGMHFPVSFEENAQGELILKRGNARIYFKDGRFEIDNGSGAAILLDEKGDVHLGKVRAGA